MRPITTAIAVLAILCCSAQKIEIGKKIPDVALQLFNYKKSNASLSDDFGNKPLIIDFWFTHCAACIKEIPKLDSLQKKFRREANILLCSFEPKKKVEDFFAGRKSFRNISLPSVVDDTMLNNLFPHHSSPHEIWIDKDGIVRAITEASFVTASNIRLLIAGKLFSLPVKEEPDISVYMGDLLYAQIEHDYNNLQNILQYSFLSGYEPHLHGMTASAGLTSIVPGLYRIHASNLQLPRLYMLAYYNTSLHQNQFIQIFQDSLAYLIYDTAKSKLFCYDLITKGPEEHVYRTMQEDLDRHFNIKSFQATQQMKCYVLQRTSLTRAKFASKGGKTVNEKTNAEVHLENVPMDAVTIQNFYISLPRPLIDETGYNGEISVKYPSIFTDLDSFNKYLEKYDLIIKEEERFVNVIYLKGE
jgi:thiol-disulfide isomerase/thioredoxin